MQVAPPMEPMLSTLHVGQWWSNFELIQVAKFEIKAKPKKLAKFRFLSDPGIPGPIYGSEPLKLTPRPFADLTDVTLADEDNNSIPTQ